MGLRLAKCPACGAGLNLETDTDFFYCPYCGSKVVQKDERIVIEHVIRTVDEAKVKKYETQRARIESNADVKKTEEQANLERAKMFSPFILPMVLVMVLMYALSAKADTAVIVAIIAVIGFSVFKSIKQEKDNNKT